MQNIKNMIGKKFNKLTVISRKGSDNLKNATWNCTCDCGNKSIATTTALKNGNKKSCGCLRIENTTNIGKKNKQNTKKRFFKYVNKKTTSKCWEWTGNTGDSGYGRFWDTKKIVYAHRFSYQKYKGKIPQGLNVLHSCDNRKCVNPKHLFLGTHQDNSSDMVIKNRQAKGEQVGRSVLKETQVIEIKNLLFKNIPICKIAKKYNVGWTTIYNIKTNKSWKYLEYIQEG